MLAHLWSHIATGKGSCNNIIIITIIMLLLLVLSSPLPSKNPYVPSYYQRIIPHGCNYVMYQHNTCSAGVRQWVVWLSRLAPSEAYSVQQLVKGQSLRGGGETDYLQREFAAVGTGCGVMVPRVPTRQLQKIPFQFIIMYYSSCSLFVVVQLSVPIFQSSLHADTATIESLMYSLKGGNGLPTIALCIINFVTMASVFQKLNCPSLHKSVPTYIVHTYQYESHWSHIHAFYSSPQAHTL